MTFYASKLQESIDKEEAQNVYFQPEGTKQHADYLVKKMLES